MVGLLSEEIRRLTYVCEACCPALDSTVLQISRFECREPTPCKANSAEACPATHCTELLNCECKGFLGQGKRDSSLEVPEALSWLRTHIGSGAPGLARPWKRIP